MNEGGESGGVVNFNKGLRQNVIRKGLLLLPDVPESKVALLDTPLQAIIRGEAEGRGEGGEEAETE